MVIVKTTYKDQVVAYVYELLLRGELQAGDQLKESLLAAQMGISRAPIREAMKELIMNGLVEYRPQVGNFVPLLSAKEIVDCYSTRGVLEGYAVACGCTALGQRELEQLYALTERMEVCAVQQDQKMVVGVGGEFHDQLISYCDNSQLLEYTNRLSRKCHVLFYRHWSALYSATEIGRRHRLIVDTVAQGRPQQIEQVIRDHYLESGTKIAALVSSAK